MSKLLLSFIGIVMLSLTSLGFAQDLIFPPKSAPSNNTPTNSRTPLTPEQFKAQVENRGQQSREDISQTAMQGIDQMQQSRPENDTSQFQTPPTSTNRFPQPTNNSSSNYQSQPTQPQSPASSGQVYTGFPSDSTNPPPSNNPNSTNGNNWNIKY